MGEHVEHAGDTQRLCRVDPRDAALCDRGANEAGVHEPRHVEFSGVLGLACHLGPTIDTRCRRSDIGLHSGLTQSSCRTAIAAWLPPIA